MSLFQHSVLNKYLKEASQEEIKQAYARLVAYFHHPERQQNIRESKEEQFQEGFLRELFVKVLGYTINPDPNYSLTTEFKNEQGARKADGAILQNGVAIGVIELKSTKTKDLEAIRLQAFDYKANQQNCVYVVTSNFEKLRFYIHHAVDFEEFDLFKLSYEQFQVLWLCLGKNNLMKGIPLEMKEASLLKEENITKQIYVDYSAFKNDLYHDLVKNNLGLGIFQGKEEKETKLLLFKKSQKLLDRFLFIFFGEDRGLLPPNSISKVLKQWQQLKELDEYKPLYDRYKKYFNYLDQGHKDKKHEIFAYNGGLFAPDEILDAIVITDEVLQKHTRVLTSYNFESDVDVNILGHIFENSLNEIEELTAQIEGAKADPKKSKRKKDGVFYTPKYITKYIVENTVGKLCLEKKTQLGIDEADYLKSRKGRPKQKLKELDAKLDDYRQWLLTLTICDPACGSGAFLNQALDFLITEHHYIDELRAKMLEVPMVLTEIENSILEKNIFGVDINEESVEIAKLSLWLRTAQKGRKLTTLSNNIKCGNSLVDDPGVAGKKAFNWHAEFPDVFKKGGFDVVVGNPPYVFTRGNKHLQTYNEYIWSNYNYVQGKINLYSVFLELSLETILKPEGRLGFITPETFIRTSTYSEIRKYLINNLIIENICIYGIGVFDNVTAETISLIIRKGFNKSNHVCFHKHKSLEKFKIYIELQESFNKTAENRFVYGSDLKDKELFNKMQKDKIFLGSVIDVRNGIATKSGKNSFLSNFKANNKYKKLLEAPNLFRYGFEWSNSYINYDKELLHRPRKEETFLSNKIMIQRVSSKLICSFDNEQYYTFNSVNNLILKDDSYNLMFLLGILNSKLIDFFYRRNYSLDANFTITVTKANLDSIPLPFWDKKDFLHQKLIFKVESMLNVTKALIKNKQLLYELLKNKYNLKKLSNKLQFWYNLDFQTFTKELKKYKINLSLSEEAEWMVYFNEQKQEAQAMQANIDKTDLEIDVLV